MRKFLLAILSVILIACLGAAAACAGGSADGTYYTLVFKKTNGVTYICEIPSGYEVLEGTTVTFGIKLSDDAEGEPVVYVNNEVLEAGQDGRYSFDITSDTTVRVDGITAQGSEYNKVVFASTPGISYTILNEGMQSGMLVKMGTEISFTVSRSESYSGEARVYANGQLLSPADGVYTITVNSPVTITVDGIQKDVKLTYVSGDTRVRYIDEAGSYITADRVIDTVAGDIIKFKVQISVYNVQEGYDVLANGTVLNPDAEGYYNFELMADTDIQVRNLIQETSFVERADGGAGTFADPFRISRPIDLYQMAMLINDGWYIDGIYYAGYYELKNDIDMEGEQLYVIGDGNDAAGYAVFSGNFNGNGHTIKNFHINDEWVDQEEYNQVYLTNVGLFGIATTTNNSSPAIYNLNIDNATVEVDVSRYDDMQALETIPEVHVGTLIGQSYGATVSGCTVTNSSIEVKGSMQYGCYVGGLIGVQLSAYSASGSIRYFSSVTSCAADVDLHTDVNYVYSAGGIVGLLAVGEEHLTSYILNSYSTGDVLGGLNAGGIAGYMAPGASIINCYSTGEVIASSPFSLDSNYPDSFYRASAGGIVGRAGFNTVIYNSFSTGSQDAISVSSEYEKYGPIAGITEDGDDLQDAHAYVSTIYGSKGVRPSEVTEDFIRNTMHWDEADWVMENGLPTFTSETTSKQFTITFSAADGFGVVPKPIEVDSEYFSISRWIMSSDDMAEYVQGNGGNRSYGYFFDEELNDRVPLSFVPTDDITLYIGYRNYNEVAGTYYLGEDPQTGAQLVFDVDGTVTYIHGALSQSATYTWDGETIVILSSALGELSDVFDTREGVSSREKEYYLSSLYNFGATLDNGTITITGGYVPEVEITIVEGTDMFGTPTQIEQTAQTGESFRIFANESPLHGLKEIQGFRYIRYYDAGGNSEYSFNGNGTGMHTAGSEVTSFTYTYAEGSLTINIGADSIAATVDDNGYVTTIDGANVQPYDGFTGKWERAFSDNVQYTFDGKSDAGQGAWTQSGYFGTHSGSYTVDEDGVLHDVDSAFSAKIENGLLVITEDGKQTTLYRGGSFAGEWYYSQKPEASSSAVTITVTLNGITRDGLGTAVAVYASTGEQVNLTYCSVENDGTYMVEIYNQSTNFATVTYNAQSHILEGTLNGSRARLTATDGVKGLWISGDSLLSEVQFNGRGYYDLAGDTSIGALAVSGTVYVGGSRAGKYTIDYETMEGSFSYRSVKYNFGYDLKNGLINITPENGQQFTLQARDSWYSHDLIDEDGLVYTFDGRGELASGGLVTATDGNTSGGQNHYRQYTYTVKGDAIELVSKEGNLYRGGTITRGTSDGKQVFLFTEEGAASSKVLTYSMPFTGKWIIGGEMGELEIGTVYADYSVSGSYRFNGEETATDVDFTYDEQGNYLSFPYNESTYYVNALTSTGITELSVGPENSVNSSRNSVCISKDSADAYYGKTYMVYKAETKTDSGEKLVFDGLSASQFGTGTAVLYNAQGRVSTGLSYTVDSLGNVRLVYRNSAYIMIEWEKDTEIEFTVLYYVHIDNDYYAILYPDSLYGNTVKDAVDGNVTYTFNGAGSVVRNGAGGASVTYKYYVLLADNITNRHILRFTAEDGTIYSVTLDQSSNTESDWTVKMTEADEYFAVYAFDKSSDTASYLFDGVNRVIRLTTDEEDSAVEYTYKLENKQGNISTFTFTDSQGKEYTAVLDQTGEEADWTLTLTAKA